MVTFLQEDFHLISSCPCWAYTSCLNGKITVGHRYAIIANRYFPLSKALYDKHKF